MKRIDTIRISSALIILGVGYLGIRAWQRNKLFDKISELIGPGSGLTISNFDKWFSQGFWKTAGEGRNVIIQDDKILNTWANTIYDSVSWSNDDEDGLYGVFRIIPDGVALSQLSEKFQKRHNKDLKEYVSYYYSDRDEQQKISVILSDKPDYRLSA
tara:strand:- start:888 stop:1358 length:471 start_codon:yes stop_codon:yes gene_type:complete